MKKLLFISALLFISIPKIYSQTSTWHLATDVLKYPESNGYMEVSTAYVNGYDTVICQYKLKGSDTVFIGYKNIYRKNGFYIDDNNTLDVFFDQRKRRIGNVQSYVMN